MVVVTSWLLIALGPRSQEAGSRSIVSIAQFTSANQHANLVTDKFKSAAETHRKNGFWKRETFNGDRILYQKRDEREESKKKYFVQQNYNDSHCDLGDLYTESGQTLQSSFSAVSKPNFASKYAFENGHPYVIRKRT